MMADIFTDVISLHEWLFEGMNKWNKDENCEGLSIAYDDLLPLLWVSAETPSSHLMQINLRSDT